MKITQEDLAQFVPSLRVPGSKTLLHVGCGSASPERLPDCFKSAQWHEVKLDVDPKVKPDIVASLTDMSVVASASVDAVWSSHNIEHLEGFQVPQALREIRRVLKPGGFALITLPDLQRIAELVAQDRGEDVLYTSPAGPITPLDMLFGHQASLARGNHYMAPWRTAPASPPSGSATHFQRPGLERCGCSRASRLICGRWQSLSTHR